MEYFWYKVDGHRNDFGCEEYQEFFFEGYMIIAVKFFSIMHWGYFNNTCGDIKDTLLEKQEPVT